MNHPIVFLTDFGLKDHYVGTLKGVISTIHPNVKIIDLCHEIGPQNIVHAAVLLKMAYSFFPSGTIFLCVVDPGVGTSREILCVRSKNYFFLAPDNGLLGLVLENERVLQIRRVENKKYFLKKVSSTFHGRDIFSPVAAHLSLNPSVFSDLGKTKERIQPLDVPRTQKLPAVITGEIIFFDHFGNAITNIQRSGRDKDFRRARVYAGNKNLGPLQQNYAASPQKLVGLFGGSDFLEIAFPSGSARQKGKLQIGDKIALRWKK
ncbi:MAG: SAM-dependent chlorinase/fluorinase [Candidatus Omnitrophica bacterium]|nr:SAM-dependent chlorinase/fluorinase [Candidatus Omnitrophota bacterium]